MSSAVNIPTILLTPPYKSTWGQTLSLHNLDFFLTLSHCIVKLRVNGFTVKSVHKSLISGIFVI